jgi:uncharacterized protein
MTLETSLEEKLNNIISLLENKKAIVAFSGGVDSSLLGILSKKYAKETLLVTERSILYPKDEIDDTIQFAKKYEIPHVIIDRNPLKDKEFTKNPLNRCYICKKGLYSDIIQIQEKKNFDLILDGSNLDDLADYRPGIKALKELGITTPYIEFKINKQEIRQLSKSLDLKVHSKPSMACYSSRFAYNLMIDEKKLDMIREAENFLKDRFNLGQLRVRLHKDDLARIEFLKEDLPNMLNEERLKMISDKFKELGFCYITIDLEGFRSGSLNEALSLDKS